MTVDGFFPGVNTIPGNVSDMTQAITIAEHAMSVSGEIPEVISLDLGFSSLKNRKELHKLGIQPGIDFCEEKNTRNQQFFKKSDFQFDFQNKQVTCSGKKTTKKMLVVKKTEFFLFKFPQIFCDACELRKRCTSCKTGRTVTF